MGNSFMCFAPKEITTTSRTQGGQCSGFFSRSASRKKSYKDEEDKIIREQALAAVLLLKQYRQRNNSSLSSTDPIGLNRSISAGLPPHPKTSKHGLARSATTRQASGSGGSSNLAQLIRQGEEIDGVETTHFVLVHGGGFGAWCWYKTMTLLSEAGFRVDAVDLAGSGVHFSDANSVQTIAEYAKPLVDILERIVDNEKVILVGHDLAGACISFAMELFPSKIAKAVFLAAPMPKNGQSLLDIFSHEEGPSDLMRKAQIFLYGNGKERTPTAINHDRSLLKDLLFNQSPAKDYALASVSMRPIPFGPVLEKLALSETNYGSVRRFYIETQDDCTIPVSFQEKIAEANPPEKVFYLKGADHSPFFSKPNALHRIFIEISKAPVIQ